MRALVQRVREASVEVVDRDGSVQVVGRIGAGLLALVGATHEDRAEDARRLAAKVAGLRVFDDEDGVPNRSVVDVGGAVLVVSQFTLYGDTRKGRRPSYVAAARPEQAEPLVDQVVAALRAEHGLEVATGRFRAHMLVHSVNDGPMTLAVEVPAA